MTRDIHSLCDVISTGECEVLNPVRRAGRYPFQPLESVFAKTVSIDTEETRSPEEEVPAGEK
jgi:hypothetical protein